MGVPPGPRDRVELPMASVVDVEGTGMIFVVPDKTNVSEAAVGAGYGFGSAHILVCQFIDHKDVDTLSSGQTYSMAPVSMLVLYRLRIQY